MFAGWGDAARVFSALFILLQARGSREKGWEKRDECNRARTNPPRPTTQSPPTITPPPPPHTHTNDTQLVILLDFVYSANEWLLERDQCAFVLIAGSGLMIVGSLVGIGFLFKVRGRGCALRVGVRVFATLRARCIVCCAAVCASVRPRAPPRGLAGG